MHLDGCLQSSRPQAQYLQHRDIAAPYILTPHTPRKHYMGSVPPDGDEMPRKRGDLQLGLRSRATLARQSRDA